MERKLHASNVNCYHLKARLHCYLRTKKFARPLLPNIFVLWGSLFPGPFPPEPTNGRTITGSSHSVFMKQQWLHSLTSFLRPSGHRLLRARFKNGRGTCMSAVVGLEMR